jgi:ribokinase
MEDIFMGKAIVLGSINIDFVSYVSKYPNPGETITGSDFNIFSGGKGANQSVALSKLSIPTSIIGKVGKDPLSNFLLNSLAENGVDISGVSISEINNTGSASIWVDDKGQNSIILYPGANYEVTEDFVNQNQKHFVENEWFLTQFEIPLNTVQFALKLAKINGLKTIVDPAPAKKLYDNNLWKLIDYLFPNELELKMITGLDDILESIKIIKGLGVGEVIVKLGDKGAAYEKNGKLELFPPTKVSHVVDTTGAGDCFVAGFLYGMIRYKNIPQAVKAANLVASYTIQKKGASISFPKLSEINWNTLI